MRAPHLGQTTVTLLPLLHKAVAAHRAVKDGAGGVTQAVVHAKLEGFLQGILGAGGPVLRANLPESQNAHRKLFRTDVCVVLCVCCVVCLQ